MLFPNEINRSSAVNVDFIVFSVNGIRILGSVLGDACDTGFASAAGGPSWTRSASGNSLLASYPSVPPDSDTHLYYHYKRTAGRPQAATVAQQLKTIDEIMTQMETNG